DLAVGDQVSRGINHAGGGLEVGVEQGVIAVKPQPAVRMKRYPELKAFGRRAIVVDEMRHPAVGEFDGAAGRIRIGDESDLIAEPVLEIYALDADVVLPEELLDADVEIARAFGLQPRVTQEGLARAECLDHIRRLDALAVIDAQSRGTSAALQPGSPDQQKRPDLRHNFGPEADLAGKRLRAEIAEHRGKAFGDVGAVVFDADSDVNEHARRKGELILNKRPGVRPLRRDSPYAELGKALDKEEFAGYCARRRGRIENRE